MRLILMTVMLVGSSAIASADSALPPIDPASVPPQCATVAAVPADAQIPQPAIEARISLASCLAAVKIGALKLAPDDASINALATATKPSFELLDVAIKQNDPLWTSIAQKVRADLLVAMAVRMRNSIPPITMSTVGAPLAEHDQAHAAIEAKIKPWLDQAR